MRSKRSTRHRGEQVSGINFDVVYAVQPGIETGAGDRSFGQVSGNDDLAVAGGAERQDAAPGAQIKGGTGGPAHRKPGQEFAGGIGPQNQFGLFLVEGRGMIGGHQEAVDMEEHGLGHQALAFATHQAGLEQQGEDVRG